MTQFATEQALWDLSGNPAHGEQFSRDPGVFLQGYNLSEEEKRMIIEMDVRGLADSGNSQMLIMLFYLARTGGFANLPEYLGRMNKLSQ